MSVEYRPTIARDLAIFGDGVLPHRIRAITVVIDGRIMGVGGLGFVADGTVIAFVHALPEAKKYPIAFHRAGLMTIDTIKRMGLQRVVAEAQKDNPAAKPWLERLGFRECVIAGHTVFVWNAGATN